MVECPLHRCALLPEGVVCSGLDRLRVSFQRSRSLLWSRRFPPPSSSGGGCSSWGKPSSAPPSAPPRRCRCCCCLDSLRSGQFWTARGQEKRGKEKNKEKEMKGKRQQRGQDVEGKMFKYVGLLWYSSPMHYTVYTCICVPIDTGVCVCVSLCVCSHSLSSSWSISGSMSSSALLGNAPAERRFKWTQLWWTQRISVGSVSMLSSTPAASCSQKKFW